MQPDPILLASSMSFLIPVTYAAYLQYWYIYGTLISVLMTSIAFHSSKDILLMRIDQLAIVHLGLFGARIVYEHNLYHLYVLGFCWPAYVYMYGYYTKSLAFSPYYIVSASYHSTIHLLVAGLWSCAIYAKYLQESEPRVL